jgi:hypothetical protein
MRGHGQEEHTNKNSLLIRNLRKNAAGFPPARVASEQ